MAIKVTAVTYLFYLSRYYSANYYDKQGATKMENGQSGNQASNRVFMYLSIIAALLLLVIGVLALWAHNFTTNMVRTELASQKIYFPVKGSPAFDPKVYPDLQKYAGQLVDTPEEARAYADGYIGRHLNKVAGGKVYAEVSALAQKDPTNKKLAQQKQTLFQGDTLRGMLLGDGYAFGTIGKVAGIAAYVSFVGSGLALFAFVIFRRKI
jgi:hypothetical protein